MPSYKSKRNTWYCAFYYKDWQGIRKKKKKEGFKTKRESQEWERKFLEKYAESPEISFAVLVEEYKKDAQLRLKEQTIYGKSRVITKHILPFFGKMPLNQITPRTVNEWKNHILAQKFKPNYIRVIRAQLSSIFNYAKINYNLSSNPCSMLKWRNSPTTIDVNYWTLDEFRQFAMYLRKPHHIMSFYLLFWTGMRVGELIALTKEDFDFSCNAIHVNKTRTRLKGKDIITTPKTKHSNRIVIMPQFLADMVKDYIRMSKYTSNLLFDYTRNALQKVLHYYAARAGVKDIRIHDLRHSHASLLINAGFPPTEVARRLGHANASITLSVYSHFYDKTAAKVAEKLNHIT